MNKKALKITIPIIVTVLTICGLSYAQQNGKSDQTSYHSNEKTAAHTQTQVKPEFMDFYDPTFEQLVADADLVIYGQVKRFQDQEEAVINGPAEDAVKEKLAKKGTSLKIHVTPVEIDIKEVISGDAPSSIILRRSELSEPYEPELKVGKRMIFVLKKIESAENTYKVMHPTGTYFDVDESGKIKPHFIKFDDLTSISLKDFAEKVKKERQ